MKDYMKEFRDKEILFLIFKDDDRKRHQFESLKTIEHSLSISKKASINSIRN